MPGAIGEGLLNNSVQAGPVRIQQSVGAAVIIQADPNRGACGELLRIPAESGAEAQTFREPSSVDVLEAVLRYELEQISKPEVLRKLKQRFGGKTIRDVRFRVG